MSADYIYGFVAGSAITLIAALGGIKASFLNRRRRDNKLEFYDRKKHPSWLR